MVSNLNLEKTNITDEQLFLITKKTKYLQSLNLYCCWKITNEGIIKMSENLHLLSSLDLTWCDKITN